MPLLLLSDPLLAAFPALHEYAGSQLAPGLHNMHFSPVSLRDKDKERVLLIAPTWPNWTRVSGLTLPDKFPEEALLFFWKGHPLAPMQGSGTSMDGF